MVLQDFKLIFDNSRNTFRCGQNVSGRLVVQVDAPKYLRSIIIKFRGEANCSWSESQTVQHGGEDETHETLYKDNDLYFENQVVLFGGSSNTEMLNPGSHFYQFSMMIPNHLPASFEGKYGHIRYSVKGIIDRPWKFNHEVMATFVVMPSLDLNLDPGYRLPVLVEKSKHFCCCCCKSGPLTVTAHIPAKGYVPGQVILITVDIENGSNVKVSRLSCELLQIISYYSTSPRGIKQDCSTVSALTLEETVRAHETRTWTCSLRVPPAIPSMLKSCSIIDLEYKLLVKAVPKGIHEALTHNISVVIGTVPLCQSAYPQQAEQCPPSAPPYDVQATLVQPPAPAEMCMTPPSYEECTQGSSGYNPKYPTHQM